MNCDTLLYSLRNIINLIFKLYQLSNLLSNFDLKFVSKQRNSYVTKIGKEKKMKCNFLLDAEVNATFIFMY